MTHDYTLQPLFDLDPWQFALFIIVITFGIMTLIRVFEKPASNDPPFITLMGIEFHVPYFTRWKGFYIGDTVALPGFALNAMDLIQKHWDAVEGAWFMDEWLVVALLGLGYVGSVMIEQGENDRGRDLRIWTLPSQLVHTFFGFPVVFALLGLLEVGLVTLVIQGEVSMFNTQFLSAQGFLVFYGILVGPVDGKTDHSNQTVENR